MKLFIYIYSVELLVKSNTFTFEKNLSQDDVSSLIITTTRFFGEEGNNEYCRLQPT